jgi:hypothetical protein
MAAKLARLDAVDFEVRPGVPHSGWPFSESELSQWYERAVAVFAAVPAQERGIFSATPRDGIGFPPRSLVNQLYRFGRSERFTRDLPAALRQASDVLLVSGATVTRLCTRRGGDAVDEVRWRTLTGRAGVVQAPVFVLAAGGIENPRLLMAATDLAPARRLFGRWLGRGFMEHPVDSSLELRATGWGLDDGPGFYGLHGDREGHCVMGRLGLSRELVRAEGLCNASLRLTPYFEPEPLPIRLANAVKIKVKY